MVISSYLTKAASSSMHLRYGTLHDISNVCMATLYNKLGLARMDTDGDDVLRINLFLRWLDRNGSPKWNSTRPIPHAISGTRLLDLVSQQRERKDAEQRERKGGEQMERKGTEQRERRNYRFVGIYCREKIQKGKAVAHDCKLT